MNQDNLFAFVTQFFGQGNVKTVLVPLLRLIGDTDGALFLSQIVYWSDRSKTDGWFYKSYAEWEEEICLSEYKVRKWTDYLEKKGVVETKVKQVRGNQPTKHYRVDMDKLFTWLLEDYKGVVQEETVEVEPSPYEKFCSSYKALRYADDLTKSLSWEFFRLTGFTPISSSKRWKEQILLLWSSADKKMDNFREGVVQAEKMRKERGLTYKGPESYIGFVKNQVSLGNKPQDKKKRVKTQGVEVVDLED